MPYSTQAEKQDSTEIPEHEVPECVIQTSEPKLDAMYNLRDKIVWLMFYRYLYIPTIFSLVV